MQSRVVDRIECEWAVVLFQGETEPANIRLADLPRGIKEGDFVRVERQEGVVVQAEIDREAKAEAHKRIQAKLERLRRGEHHGNISPSFATWELSLGVALVDRSYLLMF